LFRLITIPTPLHLNDTKTPDSPSSLFATSTLPFVNGYASLILRPHNVFFTTMANARIRARPDTASPVLVGPLNPCFNPVLVHLSRYPISPARTYVHHDIGIRPQLLSPPQMHASIYPTGGRHKANLGY